MFVDEVLIPVQYQVDGDAIVQVLRRRVSYQHVAPPRHQVRLAEGMPAESYLVTGGRSLFANGGGPMSLHPDIPSRMWDAVGAALHSDPAGP